MRRMPIIFLVDTSGRMQGERIKAARNCIQGLLQRLKQDPYSLEVVCFSVLTFNMSFTPLSELTDISSFKMPQIEAVPSTPAMLGNAISCLTKWLKSRSCCNTTDSSEYFRSRVIIFWGGGVADPLEFEEATKKIETLPVNITTVSVNCLHKQKLPDSWQNIFHDLHTPNQIWDSLKTVLKPESITCCPTSEPVSSYLPPLPKEIII